MSAFDNPAKLYFFFDYISHNAYLAWKRLPAVTVRHNVAIEPVPVLFAALLKAHGQVGPAEVAPKSSWMMWNVLRKARFYGIPMTAPYSHPFNPLLALRLSGLELPRPQRLDLIDRLFAATWAQGRAVHDPKVLHAIVGEAGLDADALLTAAEREPAKSVLRESSDAAIAAGVFGVPSMLVRGELFWGFDDLTFLDQFLTGADPLGSDRSAYAAWNQVRPSAQRTR